VPSTGFQLLVDDSQGAEVLEAMDPGDTPGSRASVDMCEVKAEPKPEL